MIPGWRVVYDAGLVEEAVLLAERTLGADMQRAFRRERDALYALADPDAREAAFEELHGRWFTRLGLDGPLRSLLAEQPGLARRARGCRLARAPSRKEETADLADEAPGPGGQGPAAPWIVLRLRPGSLLEAQPLAAFLRHELVHVDDMLDPAFAYHRRLPAAEGGAPFERQLRDRYRAVWCATIDGRLARRGLAAHDARRADLAEFARAFPMLGVRAERAFAAWFESRRPTHEAILAFILDPVERDPSKP